MRLELKRIAAAGTKAKLLETNEGSFAVCVSGTDTDATSYSDINPYNLFVVPKSIQLRNMFEIDDFRVHSSINTARASDTPDYLEEYAPILPSNDTQSIQVGEFALGLMPITYNGITAPDSNDVLIEEAPTVAIYPPLATLQSTFEEYGMWVKYSLSGVAFNYLTEFPLEFANYANFDTGILYGNSMNMKNHLDHKWDSGTSTSLTTSAELINSREYQKIGVSNVVWASYKIERDYIGAIPSPAETAPNATVVPVVSGALAETSPAKNYEYIEQIVGFNRFIGLPRHKSNLFSIVLRNTGISDSDVQLSINNIIRSMINKIIPVHTQLFNIYWR